MNKINNISDEGDQTHEVILPNGDVTLRIRFHSSIGMWKLSVTYKEKSINGVKLSAGVLHMRSANFPFDFILEDTSGNGLDPYKVDDFSTDRCILYMLSADEMTEIRGQKVEE